MDQDCKIAYFLRYFMERNSYCRCYPERHVYEKAHCNQNPVNKIVYKICCKDKINKRLSVFMMVVLEAFWVYILFMVLVMPANKSFNPKKQKDAYYKEY